MNIRIAVLIMVSLFLCISASAEADDALKSIFGSGKGFEVISLGSVEEKCEEPSLGREPAPCVNGVANSASPSPINKTAK